MNPCTELANPAAAPTVFGRRRALTLAELLATSSAVALLVAVLTPAVAGVRGRSKQTVCLQNLARIAEASIVYASDDPDDQAVPLHPQMPNTTLAGDLRRQISRMAWGGKSGRGVEDGDSYFWGTFRDKGPSTRPLNRILYGDVFPNYAANPGPGGVNWQNDERLDLPVYRCPSDSGHTGDSVNISWRNGGLTSYDHYGNSYAANALWIYVPLSSACSGTPCCDSNSPVLRRLGDISNPAQTLYYLEGCGRSAFFADPQGSQNNCGPGSAEVIYGWHGQAWQFSAAFVDGHARAVHIRGHQNPHLWHYPECPNPGQGCYQFWHCVIIRGDDWQMDTLPLDPIQSTIPCG